MTNDKQSFEEKNETRTKFLSDEAYEFDDNSIGAVDVKRKSVVGILSEKE